MFPNTIWDVVRAAGGRDSDALNQIARDYRAPVLAFIRSRGIDQELAEDLCHDVFVRLLAGNVLSKADPARGRFRSLLSTVTVRVIQDWRRRQREVPAADLDPAVPVPDFDRSWALHLTERALGRLREESPGSYEILSRHVAGEKPDRNKLWITRRKLVSLIRREVAVTCRSTREFEQEIASLAPYLRPPKKEKKE